MIIIVYPELYGIHGIARYVQSYIANLPADAEIAIVTVPPPDSDHRVSGVEVVEIPMRPGRAGLLLWSLAARRATARLLKRRGDHTVNFQVPPLVPAAIAAPRSARTTVVAHTTYFGMSGAYYGYRYFRGQWGRLSLLVKERMERAIFRRADRVLTLTQQGVEELKWYGRREGVSVVPNGVDTAKFRPADRDVAEVYDVIFVGRIERRKGSRPLVDVCKQLVSDVPGVRIAVVGYGDDLDRVRADVASLAENVKILGKRSFDEVISLYGSARVYASTSYYEGLPGTCLEAMAMGLPTVVWDLPFYSDLVLSGVTGTTVQVGDIPGFSQAIARLLSDPTSATSMGQRGKELIAQAYDWRIVAARVTPAIDASDPP